MQTGTDADRNNNLYYVQFDELAGLNGSYTPFNDINMGVIKVRPLHGGIMYSVSSDYHTITVRKGDQFRLTINQELTLVHGPNYYSNQYRAAIAATILGQSLMKIGTMPEWKPEFPYWAYCYRRLKGQDEERNFIDNGTKQVVDETWDFCVIINGTTERITEIRVRTHARSRGAEFLKKFLFTHNLERKRSGMFDVYHEQLRKQSDEKYKEWMESHLPDINAQKVTSYSAR